MDTPTAIATLTALKATIDSNVAGLTSQSASLSVAIKQLQGILNTPSADLSEADAQIATLTADIQAQPAPTPMQDASVQS